MRKYIREVQCAEGQGQKAGVPRQQHAMLLQWCFEVSKMQQCLFSLPPWVRIQTAECLAGLEAHAQHQIIVIILKGRGVRACGVVFSPPSMCSRSQSAAASVIHMRQPRFLAGDHQTRFPLCAACLQAKKFHVFEWNACLFQVFLSGWGEGERREEES